MDEKESGYKPAKLSFNVVEIFDGYVVNFKNFYNILNQLVKFNEGLFLYFYEKNNKSVSIYDYYQDDEELINLLHSKENLENNSFKHEGKVLEEFNDRFFKLFEFSHKHNLYFYWCGFNAYKFTLDQRYKEHERTYVDTHFLEFMKIEYRTVLNSYNYLSIDKHLNATNGVIFQKSKNQKLDFLNEFFRDNNVEVKIRPNDLQPHELYRVDFIDNKLISNQIENITEDMSDSTATEKIIYLEKLGVIDFLRTMQPFQSSTSSLASILSRITGEKSGTLQSMLNPMISKNVVDRNNPLLSQKPTNKVDQTLTKIGFFKK